MAMLLPDEIAHYRAQGWVIPRFRLPAVQVKGVDRSGRNDLDVGHRR